ncbi:MAG: DNA polymerase III subunit alpha [Pseudomonadota bacterium]
MSADFVHLHLHTQYSFLDGAIRIKDLFPKVHSLGQDAVAITDHGNMFGAVDFYQAAKKAGVKPIIGMEAYVAGDKGRQDRSLREAYHLVLLAENQQGYQNLVALATQAYLEGFYYVPRVDKVLLAQHAEGVIALSACLSGVVARPFLNGETDRAVEVARQFKQIFGPDHFYLEVQANGMADQHRVNAFMGQLAQDLELPLIATNDCHYLEREHHEAQDILMCIRQKRALDDPQRHRHQVDAYYVRSGAEMRELMGSDYAQACDNSLAIAERCQVELDVGKVYLPAFPVPTGIADEKAYVRHLAHEGLERRFGEMKHPPDRAAYLARLELELDVITDMGFSGYFLIVQDFINEAKRRGIRVGPGRGSGAGSIVAYALRITDIDPIPYALLFERFLNPERKSMPDFDVDFMQERRGEIIEYVAERYGREHVAQIATYSALNAKSVIKDVARTLGVPFAEVNEITKLIPNMIDGKKVSLEKALELEPRLTAIQKQNPVYHRIIETAKVLEGLYRQAGMHAAGVVIGDKPLTAYAPLFKGAHGELVTQFDKDKVEAVGLVKFDFLGLKTLDVIDAAERHVNARIDGENKLVGEALQAAAALHPHAAERQPGQPIPHLDCSLLAYDDPRVYELMTSGETLGVFQLESTGFQDLMKRIKPDGFEDVVASVALYRPGPIQAGMVDDYVNRKHGKAKVAYPHPSLEEVLKPTYGTILYQEQVMQIAQVLAGYSLGSADILRRAMGKKKLEVMAQQRQGFVDGAVHNGVDAQVAGDIFDLVEKFAGYGFNKSHSAAYAAITYQTGYLKACYPAEFLAAMLTTEAGSTDDVVKYVAEAKRLHIPVLQPDINASRRSFAVERDERGMARIRFGLSAVKGLGYAALDAIIDERDASGAYKSLFELCERVPPSKINKAVLEALVRSGAMDCLGRARAQLELAIERAIDSAAPLHKARDMGQATLFDLFSGGNGQGTNNGGATVDSSVNTERYDDLEEWPERERLAHEKHALGFYITGHPLDGYRDDLPRLCSMQAISLEGRAHDAEVSVAGVVTRIDERVKKDGGGRWATLTIEDLSGTLAVQVFTKVYGQAEALIKSEQPIWIKGRVQVDEDSGDKRLRAEDVLPLASVRAERTRAVVLRLPGQLSDAQALLLKLRDVLRRYQGNIPVRMQVERPGHSTTLLAVGSDLFVKPDDELQHDLCRLLGKGAVVFE